MAEEIQGTVLSAAFPTPPPFYKHFTPDNLARLKEAQANVANTGDDDDDDDHGLGSTNDKRSHSLNLSDLPRELLYLIPPAPPASGHYKSFGEEFDISNPLPSLRSRGIEQLYPTPPASHPPSPSADPAIPPPQTSARPFSRTHELIKLARSILLNYLDLVGTLSASPALAPDKVQDIRVLFLNAHHLINEYRPHQARETMIEMVEAQLERRRAEIEGVRAMKEKVEGVLRGLAEGAGDVGAVEEEEEEDDAREDEGRREERLERERAEVVREKEKRIWEALDAIEI